MKSFKHPPDIRMIVDADHHHILDMKFEDVRDGFLYVVQQKTAKASDAAWIRFRVTPGLQAVISRYRDNVASPYLVAGPPKADAGAD